MPVLTVRNPPLDLSFHGRKKVDFSNSFSGQQGKQINAYKALHTRWEKLKIWAPRSPMTAKPNIRPTDTLPSLQQQSIAAATQGEDSRMQQSA